MEFEGFPKIGRLKRGITISEKIDGSNAAICIDEDGQMQVQSRTRFITPGKLTDNYGFAGWAYEHKDELVEKLGPGRHFGEWWGQGINRGYGLTEKRFSLFNTHRWRDGRAPRPACCHVVPVLYEGLFTDQAIEQVLFVLREHGSSAAGGFMKPEGIVVYHAAAKTQFKVTLEKDEMSKGEAEALAA